MPGPRAGERDFPGRPELRRRRSTDEIQVPSTDVTAGSCCGQKKLRAGQRPAVHFAGVTVFSVTGTQVRAVDVSVERRAPAARITRAPAARITVTMSPSRRRRDRCGRTSGARDGADWCRPPGNEHYVE
jgi:hypothetical protein